MKNSRKTVDSKQLGLSIDGPIRGKCNPSNSKANTVDFRQAAIKLRDKKRAEIFNEAIHFEEEEG